MLFLLKYQNAIILKLHFGYSTLKTIIYFLRIVQFKTTFPTSILQLLTVCSIYVASYVKPIIFYKIQYYNIVQCLCNKVNAIIMYVGNM